MPVFWIAAAVLLVLKVTGVTPLVSWLLIVGVALIPAAFGLVVLLAVGLAALGVSLWSRATR